MISSVIFCILLLGSFTFFFINARKIRRNIFIGKDYPITANRVLALISSIFTFAVQNEYWSGVNPCAAISRNRENKRERFVMPDELPLFFSALAECPSPVTRDFIMMSLLTGARRTNVLQMRWQEIYPDRGEWVIPHTKNGTPQRIPLLPKAFDVLKLRREDISFPGSEFVFPGIGKTGHLAEPKKAWASVLKKANLTDLRLHDLRRTFGSWQAGTGANLSVIGRSLNHKSLATTKIYDRLWLDPVRDAMQTAVTAMFKAGGVSSAIPSALPPAVSAPSPMPEADSSLFIPVDL